MKVFAKKCVILMLTMLMVCNISTEAQAAGRGTEKKYQVIAKAPYAGTKVLSSYQGLRYDGLAVIAERSNPKATLSYETGMSESNFYSLGFGTPRAGWIIIEFKNPIKNGAGNDIRVVEDTWGLPYPKESAGVYVSADGRSWKYLGLADNQNPISTYHTITEFDLGKVCMKEARYVKVRDASIRSNFASYSPYSNSTLDGYDLNVVLALHDYVVEVKNNCHKKDHRDKCDKDNWNGNRCNWSNISCKYGWKNYFNNNWSCR